MPDYLRYIAWICLTASALTGLVLIFGPQEGLETLAGGLMAVFTLAFHALVGPAFIWHGITSRPLGAGYLLFMLYMIAMWGTGLSLYVTSNDLDDAAADYIESTTEPANFQIRDIGKTIQMKRFQGMSAPADDIALWHQYGREATDVNRKDQSRLPALFYAAAVGDVEMIDILMAKGADTDNHELYYRSPLSIAVENGHHSAVRRLISANADVDVGENRERSSLVAATRNKDLEMLLLLLEAGADPNLGSPAPFSIALNEGDVEIVSSLLEAGADPVVYFHQHLPIEVALKNNDPAMIELLLTRTDGVNATSEHNEPLLFDAFYACDLDSFERYLKLGADPNIRDRKGSSLLQRMSYYRKNPCDFETAREKFTGLMIPAGLDLQQVDDKGDSPAIRAVWYGQVAFAEFLVANGASIEGLMANKGFITIAAGAGSNTMIDAALERGMDVNQHTEGMNGSSPIREAARGGHTDTIRHLLEKGAELPDTNSLNMLFTLAGKHPAMTRLLLEHYVRLPAEKRSDKHVRWGINSARNEASKAMLREFGIGG